MLTAQLGGPSEDNLSAAERARWRRLKVHSLRQLSPTPQDGGDQSDKGTCK